MAAACAKPSPVSPPPLQPTAASHPECPIDTIKLTLHHGDTVLTKAYTSLPLSGAATLIPEFNDCQRFAVTAQNVYGPLVAIFAADSLNAIIARIQKLGAANAQDRALPVGIILSFDGPYAPLGIQEGFNCLYMATDTGSGKYNYAAWVKPQGADSDCTRPMSPGRLQGIGTQLAVQPRDLGTNYGVGDYPEVARWDWSREGSHEFIGIGCRERWCDIGNAVQQSPNYDDATMPPRHRRKLQIKGWYDEEVLAVNDPSGTGLTPSAVTGTLVPAPGLESLTLADYQGHWPVVAKAWLSDSLPSYAKKLNFEPGKVPGNAFNAIALCQGTRSDCSIPAGEAMNCPASDVEYYARIERAGDHKAAYRCVIHRTHNSAELLSRIAGVVRWRWKTSDQGAWIACPKGCCEVVGE